MSLHVNEFNPTSQQAMYGVRTDPQKLKFNNIQSCIAVVLCVYSNAKVGPQNIVNLIGVHLTTSSTTNGEAELKTAVARLRQQSANLLFDVYLVGPYDAKYATNRLADRLKSLKLRKIKLANLPLVGTLGANQDVKVEAIGPILQISQRDCVKVEYGVLKDKYDPTKGGVAITTAENAAGKHKYVNDKALKPWVAIAHFETLKFNILGHMKDRA